MGKTRGRIAQERRLADMGGTPASPPSDMRWSPDPGSIAEEYPINMPIPGLGRVVGRQALDEGNRLVEFSLTAQVEVSPGEWSDVVRIDTEHEEVHIHYFSRDRRQIGREVISPIRHISDVDRGYEHAYTLLVVKWADHERRWRGGC
jgi:hypothetical protein